VTVIGIPLWLRVMIPNIIIFNLLPQSDRLLGPTFFNQLACCHDPNGAVCEQVAPNPMVMPDDLGRVQVRSVAHRVTVADNNDVVIVRDGGSDGCIHTGVSRPASHEDPIWPNSLQDLWQRGSNKRIVECFLDHQVAWVTAQFWQKRPSSCATLEAIAGFPAVSNPDHLPKLLTHHARQQIDALNHSLQIVLRWAIE
jgi:hypothetical protein